MHITPFKAHHLTLIHEQKATEMLTSKFMTQDQIVLMERSPWSFTAFTEDGGQILGAASILQVWNHRGIAIAIADHRCGSHMPQLVRAIKRCLQICPLRRIEAYVTSGFEPGHRLVKLLGFKQETEQPMDGYWPDGTDAHLYSFIKGRKA